MISGWKGSILIVVCLAVSSVFVLYKKNTGNPAPAAEISEIERIAFSECASSIPEISGAVLSREEEGTRVWLEFAYEDEYEQIEDAALMDQAKEILERYEVGKWNGFDKTNSRVQDGSSFSLSVTFTNGEELKASGQNSFPPNYSSVFRELNALIQPTAECWYQKQNK